ncbi:MAG: ABC transporter substrate-binding protein [Pseudomonadota bacterium]
MTMGIYALKRHLQNELAVRAFCGLRPIIAPAILFVLLAALLNGCERTVASKEYNERLLIIGSPEEPQTLDPQYGLFGQIQQATAPVVYEQLFFRKTDAKTLYPLLAKSYRMPNPSTFEIDLREGVLFSDGSAFDAYDVVFSFKRLADPPGAGIPIKYIANAIDHIEIINPYKVIFHLTEPTPGFIGYLVEAPIISNEIGAAEPADFNNLSAAVGTGPYRITAWDRGDKIEYEPNPLFRGKQPDWDKIVLKFLPNHAARVAALMSGDIHVTNYIPTVDVPRLQSAEGIDIIARPSNRAIYFHLDIGRETSPHITDKTGRTIPNPLRDRRVREALSLAIDRSLIVDKILEGYATPAFQWMAEGHLGYNPSLPPIIVDRERARQLLSDAGYPDGFRLTLHGTAGLYGPDVRVLQAIAAMWAKIGIDVSVEALPPGVYWGPWFDREFSVALSSYGFQQHRIVPVVRITVSSDGYDNIGGYSNPEVDALMRQIPAAPIEQQRILMKDVTAILYEDIALLPIYHFQYVFGYRSDHVVYDPTQNLRDLELLRAFPVPGDDRTES